jgi:hypothetical protein
MLKRDQKNSPTDGNQLGIFHTAGGGGAAIAALSL